MQRRSDLPRPCRLLQVVLGQVAALARDYSPRAVVKNQENDSTPTSEVQKGIENEIAAALKEDEAWFCQDTQDPKCRAVFLRNIPLSVSNLVLIRSKRPDRGTFRAGILSFGGCAIYVLKQTSAGYAIVLQELGILEDFQVATSKHNGFYDLTRPGETTALLYRWTGSRYVSDATTDSVWPSPTDRRVTLAP